MYLPNSKKENTSSMKYPYLVTRVFAAFYLNTNISFVRSETECDYIDPDGSISVSTASLRSSTIQLAEGNYEIEFNAKSGDLEIDFKPIKDERAEQTKNVKRDKNHLLKPNNFKALLFLLISLFLFGCGSIGDQQNTAANDTTSETAVTRCIPVKEANSHIGETACVTGKVVSVSYLPNVRGKPTFINFDNSYPKQTFTAVIWGDVRSKFDDPEVFEGQEIEVTGTISEYAGKPQIIITEPGQFSNSEPVKADQKPEKMKSKKPDKYPPGATARCRDGWISFSRHRRGTCSHHGGVEIWF
jgi:hypothetical protein